MKGFALKIPLLAMMIFLLSGCGTLLGSKFYDAEVHPERYNDTREKFTPYTNKVILSENIDGSFNFITNGIGVYLLVAGTSHFTKDNVHERLKPFFDFLKWSQLKGAERNEQRTVYNQMPEMKKRHIEFRYFPDGAPAFVDTNDGKMAYEKALFDNIADYYNTEQVIRLISIAYTVTHANIDKSTDE
ncbi:hypothetical protein [Pantoea sp.]|nr:hypothetical protein [Pantoea sp.]